jgi:dTDP-4-amino-4,6-dideoxy-D-galactose acyltransferase
VNSSKAAATVSEQFDVLSWDSERFGFTVARVHSSIAFNNLEDVGERMRKSGVVLAYFNAAAHLPIVPDDVLSRLGGRLVDQRVTYAADLTSRRATDAGPESGNAGLCITDYRRTTVPLSLTRLARESGAFSRFRLDHQIVPGVFESIYDAWISRSVKHEIADRVLVARQARRILGFVSVKTSGICGEIGLLAVGEAARGQGLGLRLVREAHSAMVDRGCTQARVATQRANQAACALYESAGYEAQRVERVYHFWLSNSACSSRP